MATVILNPVLTSMSGAIGRMVFYKRYNKTISRAWIMPPNPNTESQKMNRDRFRQAMASWQALPAVEKDSCNREARKLSMTGHNLFISRYMKDKKEGRSADNASTDTLPPAETRPSVETSPPVETRLIASRQGDVRYRSVTAPSLATHRVFSSPPADYNPPG